MNRLTAIILTFNEAENIQDCIASLKFADHILVFDSYSTDSTMSQAEHAGVQVAQHRFENYASQRNAALDAVAGTTEWVLFVDADERVTAELAAEIMAKINEPGYTGWRIPRHNYIFGRLTRGAGWYPDYQTRLLRVGEARYDPARQVHELVILNGREGTLTHPFIHYNYRDVAHFTRKQEQYADYDARVLFEQEIHPRPQNYILQPWRQFWWRFVTLGGYRDGLHGLRLSLMLAWYELRKYLLLRSLWRRA